MLIYLCMLFFYCSSKNETTDNNLSEEKFAKVLSVEVSGKANAVAIHVLVIRVGELRHVPLAVGGQAYGLFPGAGIFDMHRA